MVEEKVLQLNDMSVGELQNLWRQYFDSEPIWKTKRYYIPRLAYRMQELVYGGVPENVRNLLLGKKINQENIPPQETSNKGCPKVGTRLVRTYRNKEYSVIVTSGGYQFEGKYYKSLSAVAYQITGKKVSGRFFFGFGGKQ